MSFIQIGNVTVQIEWVAILLAFLLFIAGEKWILKKDSAYFSDIFFYYILTWKLSYVLFDWAIFVDNPMSLLYFHGGIKGHWLGILIAILLFIFKANRQKERLDWSQLLFSFASYFLFYQSMLFILSKQTIVGALFVILTFVVLYQARTFSDGYSLFFILVNACLLAFRQQISKIEGWTFIAITCIGLVATVTQEKRILKTVLGWGLIIVLFATLSFNLSQSSANDRVTEKAVDFELNTLDGEKIRLSDYEGKKVVLNLWATWCPPCKAEMPHIQRFYEEHGDEVEVIAVNLTSIDHGKEALQNFIEEYELTFPIPLDETGEVGDIYEAFTIPTSYFIDSEGRIAEKVVGPMDQRMMERIVEKMD